MFSRGKLMLKAALEKNAASGGTGGSIILSIDTILTCDSCKAYNSNLYSGDLRIHNDYFI